jgi:hypothetical protein
VGYTFLNHLISSARLVVENVIAWVKRCLIVQGIMNLKNSDLDDIVMEITYGLNNPRVSYRHPLPTFDVLSLINSG